MLIDWFTVGAQAINFFLLVGLLKRFLYQPILDAIDAREQHIAAALRDADSKQAQAQNQQDEFQQKNAALDQQRAALLKQASEDAAAERQRLCAAARKSAEALTAKHLQKLHEDANNLNQTISRLTQQEVFAIVRKTLADLANTSLEEQLSGLFKQRLRTLDKLAHDKLASALSSAAQPALVRTAISLSTEQCAGIQQTLNETFSADIPLQFETVPDIISGIELTINDCKVTWSIASYVAMMEKKVSELLEQQFKSSATPENTANPADTAASPVPLPPGALS